MSGVLIHIGFPKAGSTYLQSWFEKNPAFFYNGKSIGGFTMAHDIARYAAGTDSMPDYFVLSNEDLSVWRGETEIVGLRSFKLYDVRDYQHKLCNTLHSLYPQGKVLLITRGYSSIFQSVYAQYLTGGGTLYFSELVKAYGPYFPLVYDYSYLAQLYRATFGVQNVKVLPYEMLRADPKAFIQNIETWLGLSTPIEFTAEKINAALGNKTLTAYHKVSTLLYKAVKPLPYGLQKLVYGSYLLALNRKKPYPLMKLIAPYVKNEIVMDGLDEILTGLQGKAEGLRHEEVYQPFLKEYLL